MRWIYVRSQSTAARHVLLHDWMPMVMSNEAEEVARRLAAEGLKSVDYLHRGKLYAIPVEWVTDGESIDDRLSGG